MSRRRRRGRWLITGVAVVAVLGTASGVVLTRVAANAADEEPVKGEPAKTAEVVKTTLTDQQTITGTLAYGAERGLSGRKPGTITGLPAAGTVLDRGKSVCTVDAKPVPLFYGDLPLYRDLSAGVDNGPDVLLVEENLKQLGFDGFGEPDEKYTAATATAVKKWQKSIGLPQSGTIGMGDVVIQPGAIRVASVTAQLGAQPNGELMKVTGVDRAVTVELAVAKQRLAKVGDKVELDINGGKSTTGTITSIGKNKSSDEQKPNNDGEAKATVSISLDDPSAAEGLDSVSASVRFTAGKREGVLAVPVGALLALAEGGYAVETGSGQLIPVRTGLFAKGQVEVSGTGLAAGMKVVTTS